MWNLIAYLYHHTEVDLAYYLHNLKQHFHAQNAQASIKGGFAQAFQDATPQNSNAIGTQSTDIINISFVLNKLSRVHLFFDTLWIRPRVDGRIRIFLKTLTSRYLIQSLPCGFPSCHSTTKQLRIQKYLDTGVFPWVPHGPLNGLWDPEPRVDTCGRIVIVGGYWTIHLRTFIHAKLWRDVFLVAERSETDSRYTDGR